MKDKTQQEAKKRQEVKDIYAWIIKNIDNSSITFHLDGCIKLVELFRHKFRKNEFQREEVEHLAELLEKSILSKRSTIHIRTNREKKK